MYTKNITAVAVAWTLFGLLLVTPLWLLAVAGAVGLSVMVGVKVGEWTDRDRGD